MALAAASLKKTLQHFLILAVLIAHAVCINAFQELARVCFRAVVSSSRQPNSLDRNDLQQLDYRKKVNKMAHAVIVLLFSP